MFIYKTTNLINGKIYIGYHTTNKKNYMGSGSAINKAFKKYGRQNFKREILEHCNTFIELEEREKFWITKYNSRDRSIGYNIRPGGNGGAGGYNNPKVSQALKEYYKDNAVWNAGTSGIYSDDYIKKLSDSKIEYFKNPNPETEQLRKDKISKFMSEQHPNAIKIYDTRTDITYKSAAEFRRQVGITEYKYKQLVEKQILIKLNL